MSDAADTEIQRAMGKRLRRIRRALNLTQEQIVAEFGITVSGWSAWELGRNRVNVVQLSRVARRYGFDINYISSGDMSGLRKSLADKLLEIPETGERRGRPSARP